MCTFGETKNHQAHTKLTGSTAAAQRDLSILTKGSFSSRNSERFPILNLDYAVTLFPNAALIEKAQIYMQST